MLKRLNLANARRIWKDLAARAENEQWSYRDYLAILVGEEIAQRQQTRLQRLARRAHFPFLKTIDEFDFTYQSTLRLSLLGSYLGPEFVSEGRSLILHGRTGRGKTHLAVAIAYKAIQNGFEAHFSTAAALIDDLSRATAEGRFREALQTYTHPHVLVVDEVGYLSYGPDAANVLFHVVNDRNLRRRPMIFTTNKKPKQWGRVLHDEDLAEAIVDRILERGRLITLDGPSVRTGHLDLDTQDQDDDNPARVSGTSLPEFPEPTARRRMPEHRRSEPRRRLLLSSAPCVLNRQSPLRLHRLSAYIRGAGHSSTKSAGNALVGDYHRSCYKEEWMAARIVAQVMEMLFTLVRSLWPLGLRRDRPPVRAASCRVAISSLRPTLWPPQLRLGRSLPSCSHPINGPPLHSPSPADPTTSSPGIPSFARARTRGDPVLA
jgi:DNA replication protein DnaC